MKGRAATGLAVHGDRAVVLLHDAMHHRKAESRALAHRLRGEKRFKDALHDFATHARTGVPHRHMHMTTRPEPRLRQVLGLEINQPFCEHEPAGRASHRLQCVGADVHQHLVHLRRVGENPQITGRTLMLEFHGAPRHRAQKTNHLAHQRLHAHDLPAGFRATRESQDLLHQLLGPARGLEHLLERTDLRVIRRQAHQ